MPEEPSLASLQRSVRCQGLMIFGLVIIILSALVASLRETYRVEKEVNSLVAQVEAGKSAEATSAELKKLESWAEQLSAKIREANISADAAASAVGKLTEEKAKADIAGASVIVLTKWQRKGGQWRCVIDEVLRENEKMPFGMKPGSEFGPANEDVIEGTSKGTGVILFFKDAYYSPHGKAVNYFDYKSGDAPPHVQVSPGNGPDLRIPAYDHMTVQRFKEIVAEQK